MVDDADQEEGTSMEPLLKRQKGLSEKHTRAHVAALLGMKSIEPHAIAYTAVQVGNTQMWQKSWLTVLQVVFCSVKLQCLAPHQ